MKIFRYSIMTLTDATTHKVVYSMCSALVGGQGTAKHVCSAPICTNTVHGVPCRHAIDGQHAPAALTNRAVFSDSEQRS
jgi:hypothetical protein